MTPSLAILETDRLILRQWRETDQAPFAALCADPEVMACFPAPLARAESDAIVERCTSLIAARGWGLWAVEAKAAGTCIGLIGLHMPAAALPFSPCVEISWRLARAWWGQGLACEGARAALGFGFDALGLDEIVAFTTLANARSRALMARLGMARDDAGDFDHPDLSAGHPLQRHCLYRLPRRQWQADAPTGSR